nr:glutathione S-transferase N-terminal domain-containing protein [Hephaestia sp. MAHUQ-44]
MLTLYYAPGACSLAPHIVLEWIGEPYEAVRVEFGSETLRVVNPSGAVPALREEDGWLLTQAGAILDYLAQRHPQAGLAGDDNLRARAEVHRWSAFLTSDLHAAFWPIFTPFRYTADQSAAAKRAVVEAGYKLAGTQLGILDHHLDGRPYILGQARSFLDAYAFPMIRWASKMLPDGVQRYSNVQALHYRLTADPAVQRVLAREAGSRP